MKATENSWKIFDQISKNYDRINRILSFGMDRSWRKRAASYLPKKEDLHLLDLASGTGDQLIACLESKKSIASAIGIDLAEEMLHIARNKIQNTPYYNRVSFSKADALHLPFEDLSFDAATFSFGIRNVIDPLACLQEIHRVLKQHGRCIILEFSIPSQPIRFFHLLYLRHFLPYIGGVLSKNKDAYRYLNQTIESFPYGAAFCALLSQAGFHFVRKIPLAFGAVTLYLGEKL